MLLVTFGRKLKTLLLIKNFGDCEFALKQLLLLVYNQFPNSQSFNDCMELKRRGTSCTDAMVTASLKNICYRKTRKDNTKKNKCLALEYKRPITFEKLKIKISGNIAKLSFD